MALQGDGNGIVSIPNFQGFGVFSITGKAIYKDNLEMILGYDLGSTTYLACFAGGIVKAVTSGTAVTLQLAGFVDGDIITYSWSRDAANLVTFDINGSSVTGTVTGALNLDSLGRFNGGAFPYNGQWQDDLVMIGDSGGNDRSYSFNQSTGSLVLPDSTSAQDGTLSGFVTGGFVGGGGGNSVEITSVGNFECKQRDGNGQAVFTIAGNCSGATSIEYSYDNATWFLLDASPTTTFTGVVTVTGQQNVTVRLSNDVSVTYPVTNLSATLTVACWWQSNMAGRLTNNQVVTVSGDNPIPISFKSGVFSQLTDPTGTDGSSTGSLVPLLAQHYSDLGVPVCFANVAVGGTSINMWDISGGNYANITELYNSVGLEYTISIGGETDTINGMPQSEMEAKLNDIVNALALDFNVNHKLVYFPIGDALSGNPTPIRLAFDSVVTGNSNCDFAGDLSVIDIDVATTPGNDGLHIKSDADAATASQIILSALTASTSTITITGIPDGTFLTTLITADRPSALIESVDRVYSGGSSTFSVNVPAGTQMYGVVRDNLDPSTDGAAINAVTV